MTTPKVAFYSDDIVVLGNLASSATLLGLGEHAQSLWRLVQELRPDNAGGFLIEAMYLFSLGHFTAAIERLENSGALHAAVNRDEALAFHLYLLQQDGQFERARMLGGAYLEEGLLQSEAALQTVRIVIDECAAALWPKSPGELQLLSGRGDLA